MLLDPSSLAFLGSLTQLIHNWNRKHFLHVRVQQNKSIFLLDRKEGEGILYLLDSSPILPPLYSCHLGALNCPLIQCHALSIYPLQQLSEIILSIASILMIFYQHQFQEYFFLYLGPFSWHKSSLKIFQSKGREIFFAYLATGWHKVGEPGIRDPR